MQDNFPNYEQRLHITLLDLEKKRQHLNIQSSNTFS